MSAILVIRLRGLINLRHDVRITLDSLNLTRVNHATIVPDNATTRGMLQRVKDYVTFGEVNADQIEDLLSKRGRVVGGDALTDAFVKAHTEYDHIKGLSEALAAGETKLGVGGIKPILRLAPPRKGHEGIKHSFKAGGALGDRGDAITALAERMV